MLILDKEGKEQDWAWLVENYGPLVIHPANAGLGWRIWKLQEDADLDKTISPLAASTIIVNCRLADGRAIVNLRVAWYWPDAMIDPFAMPLNGLPDGMRPDRAESGVTNLNGDVGFGMGSGAFYFPPAIGPHAVWVYGANSDVILGLGMIGLTNHSHINVWYELSDEPEEPEPPEPGTDRPRYYRKDGSEMTATEAVTMFGKQAIYRPDAGAYPLYEVAELHWQDGVFLSPRVLARDGYPLPGMEVFLKNNRTNQVLRALTGDEGYCQFDIKADEYGYNVPAEVGPCACGLVTMGSQVYDTAGRVNDKVLGPRVLNPVFVWTAEPEEPEEPEPPEPPDDDVARLIAEARALLAEADAKLAEALGVS